MAVRRAIAMLTVVLAGLAGRAAPGFAQTGSPFDGTYIGTLTLVQDLSTGKRELCDIFDPKDPRRTLVVQGGAFSYLVSPSFAITIKGTVGADGSLSGTGASSIGAITLAGRIAGNAFTGEARSSTCTAAVRLTRS